MIKSSQTTLKFANSNKLSNLNSFIDEYKLVMAQFVNILWNNNNIPNLLPNSITNKITTWLSQRAIQAAGKQASSIIRGTQKKQKKRLFIIQQFIKDGMFKKARKLKKIYDDTNMSKPELNNINPELDSRFVKIDFNNNTTFDGWVTLKCLGNKMKIIIPFKKHRHFNTMLNKGTIKSGVRLSKTNITFMFDIPEPNPVSKGITLGIDIGQKTILSCSNGQVINQDKDGWTYQKICDKLSRKQKNSNSFNRTDRHRTNFINWSVKQLNLKGVKRVNVENIKYLRKGKNTSKSLKHWNYRELFDKLDSKFNDSGVQVIKLNPSYTSQRCSCCGWVRKSNRKGKLFKCGKCGYSNDSDLNASFNLALNLREISTKERLLQPNKSGFYWLVEGQECIVPVTQGTG